MTRGAHLFQEIIGHAAVGDHHSVCHARMEPAVDGIASGRTLVSACADELVSESQELEQTPEEEAFAPVAVDDIRSVRPEKLYDMLCRAGEMDRMGGVQVHGDGGQSHFPGDLLGLRTRLCQDHDLMSCVGQETAQGDGVPCGCVEPADIDDLEYLHKFCLGKSDTHHDSSGH